MKRSHRVHSVSSGSIVATGSSFPAVRRRGGVQGEPAPHRVPLDAPASDALLLDSREVARLLGIGRTKAFQLMARQTIPTVHIGRCARVPLAALQVWIQQNTSARPPA